MAASAKKRELDFSAFPPGAVPEYSTLLCLAPRTAYAEIKRHSPGVEELTAPVASRPYFDSEEKNPRCPYCDAAKRWHARFDTYRIEGGKQTDAARRALLKSLPKADEQFQVMETKSDRRALLFEWLDTM